ncbi:MAG: hypothetical protein HY690_11050 [Chloroflexi bacterium]|nr:hypothetical protein [Chloroflexota bacterium]
MEDAEAQSWLPALIPLRADLANGDLRALYLAWLAGAESGMLDDEAIEPPVPPGLGSLSASLKTLAEFLGIDDDLIAVAAERSVALHETSPSSSDLDPWIRQLPEAEKNDLLLRLAKGDDPHLRARLLRRLRPTSAPEAGTSSPGRTVAELLETAEQRAEVRRRKQAEREARERARREREEAAARAVYLDGLAGQEEALWQQAEALTEMKRPADYDQAVRVLTDLRDLAIRNQMAETFDARLSQLRARHAKKRTFLDRLDRALSSRPSEPRR